jgi:uncharacterized membrane protein YgcG
MFGFFKKKKKTISLTEMRDHLLTPKTPVVPNYIHNPSDPFAQTRRVMPTHYNGPGIAPMVAPKRTLMPVHNVDDTSMNSILRNHYDDPVASTQPDFLTTIVEEEIVKDVVDSFLSSDSTPSADTTPDFSGGGGDSGGGGATGDW